MANKRIDQLNHNLDALTGNELIPIFDTVNNKTEKLDINTLSEFISSTPNLPINKFFDNGDSTPNLILDFSKGNIQKFNLITDTSLEFINGVSGSTYQIIINQEDVIRNKINWPETILWSGGEEKIIQKIGEVKLDTEFSQNIGDGFDDYVYKLDLQSDGKIIIGGEFTNFKNLNSRYISKLSFNTNPGYDVFDLTYDGTNYIISKR